MLALHFLEELNGFRVAAVVQSLEADGVQNLDRPFLILQPRLAGARARAAGERDRRDAGGDNRVDTAADGS